MSSSANLGYFEALDDGFGEAEDLLGGGGVSFPGPRIPRMAVRKICITREVLESSAAVGASLVREAVPRMVPRPPPQAGPTHLEIYGGVVWGSLVGHSSRTSVIGLGNYPESFEEDELDILKPAFLESGVVIKREQE